MPLSEQSIRELEALHDFIGIEPRRLDMASWGLVFHKSKSIVKHMLSGPRRGPLTPYKRKEQLPPCGAVGCLAGNTVLMHTPKSKLREALNFSKERGFEVDIDTLLTRPGSIKAEAIAILGIDREQADRLFLFKGWSYSDNQNHWPQENMYEYLGAKNQRQRVRATQKRIKLFIATNGEV